MGSAVSPRLSISGRTSYRADQLCPAETMYGLIELCVIVSRAAPSCQLCFWTARLAISRFTSPQRRVD